MAGQLGYPMYLFTLRSLEQGYMYSFIFCLQVTTCVAWDNTVSEDGFVNLFNGLDLQGWSMAGRGKFQVIEQEKALESEDGMGLLWYTNIMYGDFILKIDWRQFRSIH